jgi:hypothetical protein
VSTRWSARRGARPVNAAVVARRHGVEAFVNMSQMTVTRMSITKTTGFRIGSA